jgi:DNA primase
MSVIDDIKSRLDIVELVSETVKLRRSGRTYTGLCPFHAHVKNTPSFAVWADSGNWRCFGQCNEGGDAFKFIMKRDGLDFAEALRVLAQRTGVELKTRSPAEQVRDDNLDQLRQLLEEAVIYYHHLLKNAPQAQAAREHLAGRGLGERAIEMFQLGYALDTWDAALKYFAAKAYSPQTLLEAGLIVVKDEEDKTFDRFRDRLMIPVRDERGRMTGFQARGLQPDALPKFMNSPQTALFDKGRTLFGLDRARKAIRESETAIVVEGNLDVIAAHQAGFENVVSSQGTALTEHQMRLLKKHAPRIVLALDADEAGDRATLRGLSVAREALDRETEIVFDPRGLVRTEGRLGADIRVMTLPDGQDPDDIINSDPDEWRRLVGAAEPVVAYVIRVLTTGRDLDDPKVKTEIAQTVLPLIEDVAQPIERDAYRQKLARLLRVDERSLAVNPRGGPLRRSRPAARRAAPVPPAELDEATSSAEPAASRSPTRLEAYCLGALLRQPELLYRADRELQALGLQRLSDDDFADAEHRLLLAAVATALEQVDSEPADYVRAHIDSVLEPRLLALLESAADMADPKSSDAVMTAIFRLRQNAISVRLAQVRFLADDAVEQGDDDLVATYLAEMARLSQAVDRLENASARHRKYRVVKLNPARIW